MWRVFQWGLIGAGDVVRKRVAAALRKSPGSELVAVSRGRGTLAEALPTSMLHSWNFVRAVSDGREPAVLGETGRTVAEIEDAIYGRTVWRPRHGVSTLRSDNVTKKP